MLPLGCRLLGLSRPWLAGLLPHARLDVHRHDHAARHGRAWQHDLRACWASPLLLLLPLLLQLLLQLLPPLLLLLRLLHLLLEGCKGGMCLLQTLPQGCNLSTRRPIGGRATCRCPLGCLRRACWTCKRNISVNGVAARALHAGSVLTSRSMWHSSTAGMAVLSGVGQLWLQPSGA